MSANTSDWEDWQHDYKFGAAYIFPPTAIAEKINKLRAQHDPKSASICGAHISISSPFPQELNNSHIDELRRAIANYQKFDIDYGPIRTYPPHPGVCYDIDPKNIINSVRDVIHATSIFNGHSVPHKNIVPHMTIAEFGIDFPQSVMLCENLKLQAGSGKWLCSGISIAIPNDNFFFVEKFFLPFAS